MGLRMENAAGKIAMCFLVATLALTIALFAGALVAPRTGSHSGLRVDPCALEAEGWSMIDPNCMDMRIGTRARPMAHGIVVGESKRPVAAGPESAEKPQRLPQSGGRMKSTSTPDDATSSFST
jgi:hypothetical protein